jgi:hypothetical protein
VPAPFERRAITFDGKPVLLFVDATPRVAQPFLARCHGTTLAAQDAALDEDAYIARLVETAREMGLEATLRRRDDREIALDVRVAGRG